MITLITVDTFALSHMWQNLVNHGKIMAFCFPISVDTLTCSTPDPLYGDFKL